ncbi:MAG: DUF3857 domain-containing protein [Chitinophagaceae bacterium]|nr:DUF3857 domain-containing protein [Chitinophagaceae bacterium]
MTKLLIVVITLFMPMLIQAQGYNALFIADSLRKDADVVKRYEEYILTIKSPAKYTLYEKHVYTVLKPAASSYARYVTHYDRFSSINYVSAKMYDGMGKEIRHSKKSDWKDNSAYDGFSLLSDSRYKENDFFSTEYPYTVEYEEEDENNGTQGFPRWVPQRSPKMSVEYSKFTIIAPADYVVRYKQLNFAGQPVISQKGSSKIYTWEIKNIPALKEEDDAPPFSELVPSVIFAPSEFEVEGYKGNMSTWADYGKFMYQLVKGRDVLPDEIKKKVHELTDHLGNEKEKIFVLYDFLQKNTRYISIQLGIGGWQPFEASYVAEKKYGDCKALSNYMIALLKEAGITGKYVEIYGGKEPPPFVEDFPFSQSNHVISCVPLGKDTIWLECTNQTVSPGYMGSFTGNRKALMIDETGGHIVHTPVYSVADNVQRRIVTATADADGNLDAVIKNIYTGLQQDFPHSLMYDASKEDREKYLNQMFNLPTYQVLKNEYKELKGIIPAVEESLQIRLTNYASITGKRLFINPNIFGGATQKLMADTARKYDYIIDEDYRDIDSVEIKIPNGYKLETIPKEVSLQTKFGKYVSSVKLLDDRIVYYRLMEQYNSRIPAKEYNEIVKFYEQVYKSDRSKVVLVKPE